MVYQAKWLLVNKHSRFLETRIKEPFLKSQEKAMDCRTCSVRCVADDMQYGDANSTHKNMLMKDGI